MERHFFSFALAITISVIALSSCTKKDPPSAPAPAPAPASVQASSTPAAAGPAVELAITTDGDNLYFNKKEMEVKAGQTVKITFKNSSSAASNMAHNWVLVKSGAEQAVATDSMQAGEGKDWVAEGPDVIGHTRLAKPGESVTTTFTAPAAGDYTYICTYPGHSMTMKGVLHVK